MEPRNRLFKSIDGLCPLLCGDHGEPSKGNGSRQIRKWFYSDNLVGGESGVQARRMKLEWVRNVLQQADEQGVSFFFKQWGTWGSDGVKRNKKANGKILDGKIIQIMPQLTMRQF